ncbi:8-oxoguanine deaminase [Legionella birminghamensis]|uniref:8-oxoguanine deaminase n=1 Tax=Legionella birminghamensis TaxID=28083 RepID=A0A378IB93_9GAMM|nr:formimidoylglutamate deiminase [Legionella birminghamensis]KTC67788.1 8-oxoguanine deaminase [Legionella birminghamensis]STX32052.1 Isoxanthopterin deaminase [Legionella birminghamensis]
MRLIKFESLYNGSEWIDDLYVYLDEQGNILKLSPIADESMQAEEIKGWAIPGFVNAHSHAFQYAMAGATEFISRHAQTDDFWTWREAMYRTALEMTPEQMERTALMLYRDLTRQGYTSVVEFHYLHHDQQGKAYNNLAEMGERLVHAAQQAGIAITLVPVLYQQYDLKNDYKPEQRRFISHSLNDYWRLYEATKKACSYYSRAKIGAGIHSIRAVSPVNIIEFCQTIEKSVPIHMHIAEQMGEVEQCKQVLGLRPVEWFLDAVSVDRRFNLVHATHLLPHEIKQLAKSHANVVLCPSTEGNLGDGIFPLVAYMENQGSFSIGTDSHIGVSPFEELRWLDYGQRLLGQKRNLLCLGKVGNSGEILFNQVSQGGKLAIGSWAGDMFNMGSPLDCVIINSKHPRLEAATKANRLSSLIYCCDQTAVAGVLMNGKWVYSKVE